MCLLRTSILLLTTFLAVALAEAGEFGLRSITTASGLPSSEVYAAHVDRAGYTWVATKEGLCRWDGRSVSQFLPNPADPASVLSVRCYSIMESSAGTMHFGTVHGISTFNPGSQAFRNITPGGSRLAEPYRGIGAMYLINDTVFVCSGADGDFAAQNSARRLFLGNMFTGKIVPARYFNQQKAQEESLTGTTSITSDAKGLLWTINNGILMVKTPNDSVFRTRTIKKLPGLLPPESRVVNNTTGTMWVVSSTKVWLVDLRKKEVVGESPLQGSATEKVVVAATTQRNTLYLQTDRQTMSVVRAQSNGDLVEYPITGNIEYARFLPAAYYTDVEWKSDTNGKIMLAGVGGVHLVNTSTLTYSFIRGLDSDQSDVVLPVHCDSLHRITALVVNKGLIVSDPLMPASIVVPELSHVKAAVMIGEYLAMLFTASGSGDVVLFNAHDHSTQHYHIRGDQLVSGRSSSASEHQQRTGICSSLRSRDGKIWLGCYGSVLLVDVEKQHIRKYVLSGAEITNNAESNIASRIVELPDGRIWVLTDHGHYAFNSHTDRMEFQAPTAAFTELALSDAIVGIVHAADNTIWVYGHRQIGTLDRNGNVTAIDFRPKDPFTEPLASIKCLSVFDNGKAYAADRRSIVEIDLKERVYRRIRSPFVAVGREPYIAAAADHRGDVWMATPEQIEHFSPRNKRFRLIPVENNATIGTIRTALFPKVGNLVNLVLVHDKGVAFMDLNRLPSLRNDIHVYLNKLLVNDTVKSMDSWLNNRDTLMVSYGDSPFSIEFGAVDVTYGRFLRYRYLLEGYDERWIFASDLSAARYHQVSPGTYVFRVQVFDVDGVWKEPRQPLTVIIQPLWWQTIWVKLAAAVAMILTGIAFYRSRVKRITARNQELERIVSERTRDLRVEQERSDRLLLNVLPSSVATRLKSGERSIADSYSNVSVLFADLVGFTALTSTIPPQEVVRILNELFSRFDRAAANHGVERIKTIGDGYMAAAGLPEPAEDHARRMALFALDMVQTLRAYANESVFDLHLRVGINSGDVVAAVVGESRFAYDVWGDAVNVAARMESLSEPDRILCTHSFVEALSRQQHPCTIREHGVVQVKGKGLMQTYWLEP